MRNFFRFGLILLACATAFSKTKSTIQWQDWTPDLFKQATAARKLVLLDMEAVWCHWCHVMDKETYADKEVSRILGEHFIAVKVDQDARPDLSNRYQKWGWPATIVFDSSGREIGKFSGYIEKNRMISILSAFVKDPTPGPSAEPEKRVRPSASHQIDSKTREQILALYEKAYDKKQGGWDRRNKLIDWYLVEYLLRQDTDRTARARAVQTLEGGLQLIDPVWGGVYQYSEGFVWNKPHFEKIMDYQSAYIRSFVLASLVLGDKKYLSGATRIGDYLLSFLSSPEGAFYTSQDADVVQGEHSADYFKKSDAARRKIGIPRVDKNLYARENGWAIRAMADLYSATREEKYLKSAEKAANWILKNRIVAGGGFKHGEKSEGLYLGDTLAMGMGFLALYQATADLHWLKHAGTAANFIHARFATKGKDKAGYASAENDLSLQDEDENLELARFANLLFNHTGEKNHQDIAKSAGRFVSSPDVATQLYISMGALLLDDEMGRDPVHVTVVGEKKDPAAKDLYWAALRFPTWYRRLDWQEPGKPSLPNTKAKYPPMKKAAAFACSGTRCSFPAYSAKDVSDRVKALRDVN